MDNSSPKLSVKILEKTIQISDSVEMFKLILDNIDHLIINSNTFEQCVLQLLKTSAIYNRREIFNFLIERYPGIDVDIFEIISDTMNFYNEKLSSLLLQIPLVINNGE